MDSVYIVMPAYNEEANIEQVVRDWYPLLEKKGPASRLVIADSGSTDSTHEILVRLQRELPSLVVLTETEKQHGPKVIALYDYAIRNHAGYIFQTDSDGQTNPQEFHAFWENRRKFTGIFGWRKERKDGKDRAAVETAVCLLLQAFFGVKIPDANAPFRLMNTETVAKYLYRLPADYNIPNIMITTYYAYYNEKITFHKISFKPRKAGVNSMNIPKILKIGINAVKDFRQFKKEMT